MRHEFKAKYDGRRLLSTYCKTEFFTANQGAAMWLVRDVMLKTQRAAEILGAAMDQHSDLVHEQSCTVVCTETLARGPGSSRKLADKKNNV
jgi:hypothetical protein